MRRGRRARIAIAGALLVAIAGGGIPARGAVPAGSPPTCPAAPPLTEPSAWDGTVIYEVFVRSFADSDADGSGDLAGLLARLDLLNDGDPGTTEDLGVGALWLMPIFPSPSWHGYDVTDDRSVDPEVGSVEELRALVAAAHARGIRVILDLVINHTSSRHPDFLAALAGGPERSRYLWAEEDPGWPPVAGGAPWHAGAAGWYYGAFSPAMPDRNLRDPGVTADLHAAARFWLEEVGVDGFRLDGVKHLVENGPTEQLNQPENAAWLRELRSAIHAVDPDALVLGEVWDSRETGTTYRAGGALDAVTDFAFGDRLVPAIARGDGAALAADLAALGTSGTPGWPATFLTNHDQERIASRLSGLAGPVALAAAVLLTAPGIPIVWQGEELGMPGQKPDERIRAPLPWDGTGPGFGFTGGVPWQPFEPGAETRNVAAQVADAGSLRTRYGALIRLRGAHPALGAGASTLALTTDARPVAAILRTQGPERIVVLHNLSGKPVAAPALTLAAGPLCGTPRARLLWASDGSAPALTDPRVTAEGGVTAWQPVASIGPWGSLVIALDEAAG